MPIRLLEHKQEEEADGTPTHSEQRYKRETFALTLRHVEDSIRPFDGRGNYPVKRWIKQFEEIAEITGWNELQKLIFARKSLKEVAKLFVQAEKGIKTWAKLRESLKENFR